MREGRLLGWRGGGVAFFGARFLGAGFAFSLFLDGTAAFFGGGECSSPSSSSRPRFKGGDVLVLAMSGSLEVGDRGKVGSDGAISAVLIPSEVGVGVSGLAESSGKCWE